MESKTEETISKQEIIDTVQAFIFYSNAIRKAKSNKSCLSYLTKKKMELKRKINSSQTLSDFLYNYQRSIKIKLKNGT